jgi:hypothetical protein
MKAIGPRLAPEQRFSAALDHVYAVLAWTAEHTAKSQQPGVVELAALRSDQPPRSGRAPPGQLPMGNWNARELMRRE